MNSKIIDGKMCTSRDVIYSSISEDTGVTLEQKDIVYSWDENDQPVIATEFKDSDYAELELRDTQYSSGLSTRLIMLKRPLAIQLIELYKDHQRMYKSKGSKLKQDEIDILLDDFRYELHRIVAKAKDSVVNEGGNLDTLLRLSSFQGGIELTRAAKSLTVLFKRIETAYTTFGYIPRDYQTKLNDALSVLISHFIMDIYGPELERRKQETSVFAKSSSNVR